MILIGAKEFDRWWWNWGSRAACVSRSYYICWRLSRSSLLDSSRSSARSTTGRCLWSRRRLFTSTKPKNAIWRNQSRVLSEQRVCERGVLARGVRRSIDQVGAIDLNRPGRFGWTAATYIAFNIATRLSCRPPSKASQAKSAQFLAPGLRESWRSPIESTFASLCVRESWADSSFQQSAQRTPCTLFATIASPLPEPRRQCRDRTRRALLLPPRDEWKADNPRVPR
jgi:hypothetical protein